LGDLKEKVNLGNEGIELRLKVKQILEKYSVRVWTGSGYGLVVIFC